MKRGNFPYSILNIFILIVILFVLLSGVRIVFNNNEIKIGKENIFQENKKLSKSFFSEQGYLDYALKLKNYGFLNESAEVFEDYVKEFGKDNHNKSAGIFYSLALDFFDANYFKKALLYLLKAEMCFPNEELRQNIFSKQMICMERLGLRNDAKNLLNSKVSLKENELEEESSDVKIIAKVGNEKITEGKFKKELNKLPKEMQEKILNDKNEKLNFVKNMIFMKVLYNRAFRLGMDKDEDIVKKTEDFKKELIVNQLIESEIGKPEIPSEIDLKNYYEANISKFNNNPELNQKSFEEIKDAVLKNYLNLKRNEKINKIIEESLKVDEVKMFEENL